MRSEVLACRRLLPVVVGLTVGGYLARLGLELSGRPWPWPVVLTVGALLMGTGGLLAWRVSRPQSAWEVNGLARPYWPLLLLALYLVWPQRQPSVAMWLLGLVGLSALLDRNRRVRAPIGWFESWSLRSEMFTRLRLSSWGRIADLSTFTLSLFFYILTTAPDVLPADSGEFQIVAPLLGVAHPPGYPLYTIFGWLFTRLIPVGPSAYRLNLMSAVLAAGTLTLLGAATRVWARHLISRSLAGRPRRELSSKAAAIGGLASALTLGTATTFWSQATVANIRMPTMFFAAWGLYALARYAECTGRPQADHALGLLAVALSLGVGHHPSLIFFGIFFGVYLVLVDPALVIQPRRWWRPLILTSLALLPLIYLPLRGAAEAPLAPPDLDTWDGLVHHITAQGFEGDMFAFANARDLPRRLMLLPTLFRFQFNLPLLAAAGLGLLVLAWRDRRLLVLLLGGLALHTFVSITYRAPQTIEYLMPAYLPVAILVGLASAWWLSSVLPRHFSRTLIVPYFSPVTTLVAAAVLLAGLANGLEHGPSFFTLARDRSTRSAMEGVLDRAPTGAQILADWHWATPLWYLQRVEDQRPDVEVHYVFPIPGQEYPDTWRDRIEAAIGEGPLLLTHAIDLSNYTLEPVGQGFWVHPRPHQESPNGFEPLDAVFAKGGDGDKVRLLGYRLSDVQPKTGRSIELTLAWQPVAELAVPPSFSAKLLGEDGQLLTQDDRYLGSGYARGEIRFERLVLPLYPNIAPGGYALTLEVYSTSETGFETWPLERGGDRLNLVTLSIQPDRSPPITLHSLSILFTDGPTLVGVDYDRSVPETLRLYLHWRGPAERGELIRVGDSLARMPSLPEDVYHTVLLDLPGAIGERLHLTLTGVDGELKQGAGPWGWPLKEVRLPTAPPSARFVPLGDQMALIGVSPPQGQVVVAEDSLLLRLTFLALQPLIDDYGVSVRLWDEGGRLRRMHDLQPALGAIPTLKWIRGSRIIDPHPLPVPPDIPTGLVTATAVVYDNFRGTPLRPLDGRMSEIPLGEWMVSRR